MKKYVLVAIVILIGLGIKFYRSYPELHVQLDLGPKAEIPGAVEMIDIIAFVREVQRANGFE